MSTTDDDVTLISTARANSVKLNFDDHQDGPVPFPEWYREFVDCLSKNWSEAQPSAQVRGTGATKSFMVASLADDDETVEISVNHMIEILPGIVERVQATRVCFAVIMDLPSRPEGLLVGGSGANGGRILGFMEITRDAEGREHLGSWTPVDADDEDYSRVRLVLAHEHTSLLSYTFFPTSCVIASAHGLAQLGDHPKWG